MSELQFGRSEPLEQGNNAGGAANPTMDIRFHGKTGEFFGIWIVNLLLSIITIGIYSAWAKVRTRRYFYGNTEIDGHRFDYHASPMAILKGRIVLVVAYIILAIIQNLFPIFAIVFLVIILVVLPWIINKGLAFNARMTSFKNIRFAFEGTYWGAAKAFVIMPIVAVITLGVLAPYATRTSLRFIYNNHSFGTSKFHVEPTLKPLYMVLLSILGIIIVASILLGIAAVAPGIIDPIFLDDETLLSILPILGIVGVYIPFILGFIVYQVTAFNMAVNTMTLEEGHRFSSSISRRKYTWIMISNLIAITFTLGLLIPWAMIRANKYVANHIKIHPNGTLDQFVDFQRKRSDGLISGEYMDIEGIDFGI